MTFFKSSILPASLDNIFHALTRFPSQKKTFGSLVEKFVLLDRVFLIFTLENYEIKVWKIFGNLEKGRGNRWNFENSENWDENS